MEKGTLRFPQKQSNHQAEAAAARAGNEALMGRGWDAGKIPLSVHGMANWPHSLDTQGPACQGAPVC